MRYQGAICLRNGRWHVRPDLVSQLEERERTHPQARMAVERIGPERTVPTRETVRGPVPATPEQPRLPDPAKERAALGQAIAKQERSTYVAEPTGFNGRALDCVTTPSGRELARIVNYPA